MLNEKIIELGKNSSEIRELSEYGDKRKAEIGAEKVFDFSIGSPNVPCPDRVTQDYIDLLENMPTFRRKKNSSFVYRILKS